MEEAGRLEHWGIWPKCKDHKHIKKREAREGAEAGLLRFVGGEGTMVQGPVSMVTTVAVTIWKPVATARPDGSKLMGMRTWGLASRR